jgi:hypothetical protein
MSGQGSPTSRSAAAPPRSAGEQAPTSTAAAIAVQALRRIVAYRTGADNVDSRIVHFTRSRWAPAVTWA